MFSFPPRVVLPARRKKRRGRDGRRRPAAVFLRRFIRWKMSYQLLNRLRVVESSAFIAAPLAGMALAQFGADVIRIDPPGGGIDYGRLPVAPGGRSLYWTGLNKGKRSFAVDIRRPEGRELVRELTLAASASGIGGDGIDGGGVGGEGVDGGVLLTNLGAPWLSHGSLAERRPDVVTCTIEGNPDGTTAVDYTVNCATGFPATTGGGSIDAPVNHVLPAWDVACAWQAAFAVVAAVAHRRATGRGAELRLALADVAFSTLAHIGMTAEVETLDRERPSLGNHLYGAFGRDFATADGRRVFVAAVSLSQWRNLVKACGVEAEIAGLEQALGVDLSREGARYQAREAVAALLEPRIAAWTYERAAAVFNRFGVCWGLYQTVRQALRDDPRLSDANPVFERIDTPGVGSHLAAGAAVRFAGAARSPIRPAPMVGAHTDEVLMDVLKLDSAAVGRLHDAGVVAGPECDPYVRPDV